MCNEEPFPSLFSRPIEEYLNIVGIVYSKIVLPCRQNRQRHCNIQKRARRHVYIEGERAASDSKESPIGRSFAADFLIYLPEKLFCLNNEICGRLRAS